MKRGLWHKLIVLLFGFSLISCMGPQEQKTLEKLRQIAAETPVYPGFKEQDSSDIVKSTIAVLTYDYQSAATYDEVKRFYAKELNSKGWSGPQEETNGDGTVDVRFQKGEYSIAVFYDSSGKDWDYAISYGWKVPG